MSSLQDLVLELWKPNSTRSRYNDFKPVFRRYDGFDSETEFNNVCRTIEETKDDSTVISDGNFAFRPRVEILQQIKKELPSMDLHRITPAELTMFADPEVNSVFLSALGYTFSLAERNRLFSSRKQQENFISNLIVYTIDYLLPLRFKPDQCPKVIFYDHGNMDERSFWFLILCYVMGMDVVVLEPAGEPAFWTYDLDHLSEKVTGNRRGSGKTLAQRAALGQKIEKVRTNVSVLSSQIDDSLFVSTGVFKPWTYRGKPMREIQIEGTRIDLEDVWGREARFREGFAADHDSITVPTFYAEIDGVDKDPDEYARLLSRMENAPDLQIDTERGRSLLRHMPDPKESVKLVFSMNPDGTFDYEKLRDRQDCIFDQLSDETAHFFVDKLNEFILAQSPKPSKNDRVQIAAVLLSLSKEIGRMIENHDYPFNVPKVLLFLFKEEKIIRECQIILPFLKMMGFDVAIFAPSGVSGLADRTRTTIRLDKMDYDMAVPPILHDGANGKGKDRTRDEKKGGKSFFDFFR